MGRQHDVVQLDESLGPSNRPEPGLEVVRTTHADAFHLNAKRACAGFYDSDLGRVRWMGGIPQNGQARELRNKLLDKLHSFRHDIDRHEARAREVPTRPRQRTHDSAVLR
jgi:hypothetical protein